MRILTFSAVAVVAAGLIFTSCRPKMILRPCENVICTQMLAMVTATVRDANGNAVTLDEVYTVREGTGERLTFDQQMADGRYVVLDDSYVRNIQTTGAYFHFIGKKNGATVVDERYRINADCCHINKESGADTIVVP